VVGVDSPNDSWVRDQLRVFGKVNVKCSTPAFIVYSVTKSRPLRRRRDFRCQCTVRVGDRMLSIVTRPGVFAHRKIDGGARRLIRAIPVLSASRIMDLGCGSGAVALAVAAANPQAQILAVDSNARALACLAESLAINGVRNVQTELNCDGRLMCADRFQLLLANPPYYSNFRIARQFLETAIRYLEPGGRVIVVTKSPAWYAENWPKELSKFSIEPSSGYSLVSGTRV
jgi:16S rRNA (guanine1207-N2)-methyltransferase